MRINKYIASSGLCSRRKAEVLIKQKLVKINNQVVDTLSKIVSAKDVVTVCDKKINIKKNIYLVINKPINVIVSKYDVKNRTLIYDFIPTKLLKEFNIHAVGRLDLYSVGVLLLTNDGDLTNALLHPKNNVIKIYYLILNKCLVYSDLMLIKQGIMLEEGLAMVDNIYCLHTRKEVVIKLHIGWNRIIRRIFKIINYKILFLQRVAFDNIKLSDLQEGDWRYLHNHEISNLKRYIHNYEQ